MVMIEEKNSAEHDVIMQTLKDPKQNLKNIM